MRRAPPLTAIGSASKTAGADSLGVVRLFDLGRFRGDVSARGGAVEPDPCAPVLTPAREKTVMRFPSSVLGILVTTAVVSAGSNREFAAPLAPAHSTGQFGASLDLDGDILAASTASANLSAIGTLAIFERTSAGWSEIQSFSGTAFGAYGVEGVAYRGTVAVDGDRIAFGIPLLGEVRIYARTGGVYQLEQTVLGSSFGRFGSALALQGDRLAVGAWQDSASGFQAGAVHVFVRFGGTWVGTQTMRPPPGSDGTSSGWSVTIDGDTIATAERVGTVRVYDLVGGSFVQTALLSGPTNDCVDVALDGDTLVAGADASVGQVRVWRRTAGTWSVEATIPGTYSGFGGSVALHGNEMIVSEPSGPYSPSFPGIYGSVHRYVRSGATWTHRGTLDSESSSQGDLHGACVAVDGVTAAAGSPRDDTGGLDRGSVHAYRLLGTLGEEVCSGASPAPCPCANNTVAAFDEGCRNSTGHGAFVQIFGSASVVADDLYAAVSFVRPNGSVLLFQGGATAPGSGTAFRDGVLCVGGTIRRLRIGRTAPDGVATIGPGLAGPGAWTSGQTIVLQAWHRDGLGPCGQGSNLTQGVRVVLAP